MVSEDVTGLVVSHLVHRDHLSIVSVELHSLCLIELLRLRDDYSACLRSRQGLQSPRAAGVEVFQPLQHSDLAVVLQEHLGFDFVEVLEFLLCSVVELQFL